MSCRQVLLLLLGLCAWMLLQVQVQSVALSRVDPAAAESPTADNSSSSSNCTRRNSSTSSTPEHALLQKRQAMLEAVRTHMLAKLNMKSPPKGSNKPLTPAQLAQYRSLMKVLEQDDGASTPEGRSGCGAGEETTHFSKHLKMYSPESFVPTEKPELFHQLGKKKKKS